MKNPVVAAPPADPGGRAGARPEPFRAQTFLGELAQVRGGAAQTRAEAVAGFLRTAGERGLEKAGGPAHVTASCVVFSPDGAQVLLTLHRKGNFWVQFGGHVELADASARAAALRECREESGLEDISWLSPAPVDAHTHDLPGAFGACRTHHDIVYSAVADPAQAFAVSAESLDVAWHPVDALPETTVSDLSPRLAELWTATVRLRRR